MPDDREALKAELERVRGELEAHEGLVRLAMDDMRHLYEDLLSSQVRLLQADKLAAIGILTAGIVHEIKNPLMFTHGNVWLLQEGLKSGSLPPNAPQLLEEALVGLDRIMTIVQDVRTFSRSDKGRSAPEDLNRLLESVIRIVWNEIKKKAELRREFGVLGPVTCNAQQIGQVFLNLLVNASQAIEGQGVITVRTRPAASGGAVVEIQDTGKGMTPEVQARLFEPFFTTKGAEEGTGLGLSISADILKRHGGRISARSAPGEGTTFTVELPA